ncbi:MAG TPA: HAMP domain-containing sensor histidine kinase [Kofleriaceae bacterium]
MRSGISDSSAERFRRYLADEDADRGSTIGVLEAFFENASAALVLLDHDLRCVQVNAKLAAITGLPIDAHPGRALADLLPVALDAKLHEVLRSGHPIDKIPLEVAHRSFLATFFPVFAENRMIKGLGGILIDITEHRRLERELRAAIEMRERVLAVVSHDLRNPLGTIQLAITTMPDATRVDREGLRRIEIVERATKMMETLICDLLDMATIQTGTLKIKLAHESADAIIREAVELQLPHAEEKGLTLVDDTHVAGVRLRCDRTRLLQVLSNLVANAIKFCKAGDVITLRGRAHERSLVLEIVDTGPGIPASDIPHLFEQYWSTARGRQRGTGLGLFISHALVEAHGGSLTVTSSVGVGTSFRIVLPLG